MSNYKFKIKRYYWQYLSSASDTVPSTVYELFCSILTVIFRINIVIISILHTKGSEMSSNLLTVTKIVINSWMQSHRLIHLCHQLLLFNTSSLGLRFCKILVMEFWKTEKTAITCILQGHPKGPSQFCHWNPYNYFIAYTLYLNDDANVNFGQKPWMIFIYNSIF